jgi:phosphoglycolate phosphatase-like HAD superfamily hydrolase
MVERFEAEGLRRVVATSAGRDDLALLLKQAGVADLMEECTSSSDVENSKPDPDIVLAALELSGAPADEAVMIGDTPYDVEAALRAGIRIIALRSGGWGDSDLTGAIAIYDHPADLLRNFHETPFS